uniref:Uncharacterized protein n=1 Tax=Cyanothece sp. (strain PCC 7425 / ATCC 29141) TaxID=395961 RepID=B8HLR1_CYAP4
MKSFLTIALFLGSLAVPLLHPTAVLAQDNSCEALSQSSAAKNPNNKSTYDAASKTLNIQVDNKMATAFWEQAKPQIELEADKILKDCPTVNVVNFNFGPGYTVTRQRTN